jgi:hypothetical protein
VDRRQQPVIIQGDIKVTSTGSLAIEAGTIIEIASTDINNVGTDPYRVEFLIDNPISVNGTVASPVIFRAQNGTTTHEWDGIRLETAQRRRCSST